MKKYIKEYILENLKNLEGTTCYLCDLSGTLYESDNVNGTITFDRYDSRDFLREHESDFAHVISYWKFHSGTDFSNEVAISYFNNPEKAHCLLVFAYVDAVIGDLLRDGYKKTDWNEEQEINAEFIEWVEKNIDKSIDAGFDDMESYTD